MAACETNPFLLCDVLPSAVTSSGRRALLAFEDAFDGEPPLQRHPLRQLILKKIPDLYAPKKKYNNEKKCTRHLVNSPAGQYGYMTRQWYCDCEGSPSKAIKWNQACP